MVKASALLNFDIENDTENLKNSYCDKYQFSTTNEADFLWAVNMLGVNRRTETVNLKNITFHKMPSTAFALSMGILEKEDEDVKLSPRQTEAMLDSHQNGTAVFAEIDGKVYPLRYSTAMSSLCDRVDLRGSGKDVLPPAVFTRHLNDYMLYVGRKRKGKVIFNNRKIEAITGSRYVLMPSEEIMQAAFDVLEKNEESMFLQGIISHYQVEGTWNLGRRSITLPFDNTPTNVVFEQDVVISTSDNATRAVTISPTMKSLDENHGLDYCLPIRMDHIGKASVARFRTLLEMITLEYDKSEKRIVRMANTSLAYPVNVLLGMYKWLSVPAKYGAPVWARKQEQWKHTSRSAYEIYSTLSEVLSYVLLDEDTENKKKVAEFRERFARALSFDFDSYDLPGVYDYNSKVIGSKGA